MSGNLQGEVGLHRDADFRGAAGIVRPAAIGAFHFEKVVGGEADARIVRLSEEREQQDELGLEDGVAFEFADPVAVRALAGEQAVATALGSLGHVFQPEGRAFVGFGHGRGQGRKILSEENVRWK